MNEPGVISQPESFPGERTDLRLRGPAGWLECAVDLPEPDQRQDATVVISHPHPQHGGSMHNKVVTILERSLRELGLSTVRYNYRGVGDSEGQYDDGFGETDDLLAVVDWVRRVRPDDDLWLAGFSFGSWISLKAAAKLDVRQLITVAPPVERFDPETMEHPNCDWLVIQGDEDEVVSADAVQAWVESLDPQPEMVMMPKTGHFFHRRLMDLRGAIKNAVRHQFETSNPTAD